jgi:hypothetical protein
MMTRLAGRSAADRVSISISSTVRSWSSNPGSHLLILPASSNGSASSRSSLTGYSCQFE